MIPTSAGHTDDQASDQVSIEAHGSAAHAKLMK